MTGLLTAAAAILVFSMLATAAGTLGRATPSDPNKRGRWGMVTRTSQRNRPLNPQERRWQTLLIAGKDADTRWRDVVSEVETLRRLNSITTGEAAPDEYSSSWLNQAVSELEATIDAKTISDADTKEATTP